MNTKCSNCQIGTYLHSASEELPLHEDWEVDGLGDSGGKHIFNFCPVCGNAVDNKFKERADKEYDEMKQNYEKRMVEWEQCRQGNHMYEIDSPTVCKSCFSVKEADLLAEGMEIVDKEFWNLL